MFGILQAGLLLFTQVGLQHGVEVAARCASVNYSANQILPANSQSCFSVATSAVTNTIIKNYAAQNSWGINSSSATFTVTPPSSGGSCGTNPGYQVTASYPYNLMKYLFHLTLSAKSCFPINVS